MQTHRYQFRTHGNAHSNSLKNFKETLENNLRNSSECLMAYCIFPTDSDILDRVIFDWDKNGNLNAINLYTYTKLWDGMEKDLITCMEANVSQALMDCDYDPEHPISIGMEDDIVYKGIYGEMPKTLYHIAERKDINDIMKKGLIPDIGSNNYKNTDPMVYLCEEKDLASWLAVLKHKENPVVLQISTLDSEGYPIRYIESGRMFKDRDYIPDGYGEYRTEHQIPPEVIKEVDFGKGHNEFATALCGRMTEMLERTVKDTDMAEVQTGLNRLAGMGLMKQEQVEAMVETHKQLLIQEGPENINKSYDEEADSDELPWDENDNGRSPMEDDFSRAISEISTPQDTEVNK